MIRRLSTLLSYRQRQLLASKLRRATRWEFWPMWLLYIPVVLQILWLTVKYRSLAFTAVNPGLPGSGFIGENKSLSLLRLQGQVEQLVAKTLLVEQAMPLEEQLEQCQVFMQKHQLSFPVIAKPDFGQRGIGVIKVEDNVQLRLYLQQAEFDTVVQEYIEGVEFGVFYTRQPDTAQGDIFSITHKCFPVIKGDGHKTLEQLIFEHPRLRYMASFLLGQQREHLAEVPACGEVVEVVKLGSHCQGSLFLDGQQYMTRELAIAVEQASQQLEGFYFGRFDIRAESIEAFKQGKIRIIEVNGVTSESTNIYDPQNSLLTAYRILFKQWAEAFTIGKKNIASGYPAMGISDLIAKVRIMNHG